MKRSQLLAVFAIALLGALAGMGIYNHVNDQVTVHAQGASGFAPGQLEKLVGVPTAVGNWFGVARPCTGNMATDAPGDVDHQDFCTGACNL